MGEANNQPQLTMSANGVNSVSSTKITLPPLSGSYYYDGLSGGQPLDFEFSTQLPYITITGQIYLQNGTDSDITGVAATWSIPSGFSFVKADNGGTCSQNIVTWNLGTMKKQTALQVSATTQNGIAESSPTWEGR
jgi:hypothetical protein